MELAHIIKKILCILLLFTLPYGVLQHGLGYIPLWFSIMFLGSTVYVGYLLIFSSQRDEFRADFYNLNFVNFLMVVCFLIMYIVIDGAVIKRDKKGD